MSIRHLDRLVIGARVRIRRGKMTMPPGTLTWYPTVGRWTRQQLWESWVYAVTLDAPADGTGGPETIYASGRELEVLYG